MLLHTEQYDRQLIDVWRQSDLLRTYNEQHWDGQFSEADFRQLNLSEQQPQTLGHVATIHAEFETPVETLRQWRNVYFQAMSGLAHWNSFYFETSDIDERLQLHPAAQVYEPGLHVVHVDMTNGLRERGSVDDIRADAITAGKQPAHAEVVSLLGLQHALRKNSGNTSAYTMVATPYLPGYKVRNDYHGADRNKGFDWVPRFDYGQGNVGLRIFPTRTPHIGAVPVIAGSSA